MNGPSDPERLADGGDGSQLSELMSSARGNLPSEAQLATLAGRMGAVLDAPVPAAPIQARGAAKLVKACLSLSGAALVVGAAAYLLWPSESGSRRTPIAPSALAPAPGSTAPAMPVAQPSATHEPAEQPAPPSSTIGSAPTKRAPATDAVTESGLLEQARHSLASAPATALALTAKHAARFPHGVLTQEREVIAIEALRRLHRTAEAEQRAAAFAKAFPGSAHQRKLDEKPQR